MAVRPNFDVSETCLAIGLRAGAVLFQDVVIRESSPALNVRIEQEVARIRDRTGSAAEIRELTEIVRHHEILKAVNVKPKRYPPSTQKLIELAWKRGVLPRINNLVDAYNLISLQTRCSLGAHDLSTVSPPIRLTLFDGGESFVPLGSSEAQPVVPGEFGYVDAANRVVCRLDSRQAEFSKVTSASTHVMVIIETTDQTSSERWQEVAELTSQAVLRECGGQVVEVVSPEH